MPKMYEFYCTVCGTKVRDSETTCPTCKLSLTKEGTVRSQKINISRSQLEGIEDIYRNNFHNLSFFTHEERKLFKKHAFVRFPVWACVVLHFITLGLFDLIYFGLKHGKLPVITQNDPSSAKAIGYMFIPFYSIYWVFFNWMRLTDRINLQYKLIGKEPPLSRGFVKVTLIIGLIPYIGIVDFFIFRPVVIGMIQSASNNLVKVD